MKPDYPDDLSDVDLPDHLDLNKADEQILNYLVANIADVPINIAEALDYDRTYIQQRLKRMEEHQIVTNRGRGVYEINRELYDTYYSK
jgi:predicted transcriptional regulator